jgi:hypothetical protein
MTLLGHNWTQRTVSAVEQGERHVNVDELAALALVLESSVPALLDPYDADAQPDQQTRLDIGTSTPLPAWFAREWLRGQVNAGLAVKGDRTAVKVWHMTAIGGPIQGGFGDYDEPTDAERGFEGADEAQEKTP